MLVHNRVQAINKDSRSVSLIVNILYMYVYLLEKHICKILKKIWLLETAGTQIYLITPSFSMRKYTVFSKARAISALKWCDI